MLEIKDLTCKVKNSDKTILNKLNLVIKEGEVHVIEGPNGAGKSTLAKIIMNHYNYEITGGVITFNGYELNKMYTESIARLGIFLCMQDPTVIEGVSNSEFLKEAKNEITNTKVDLFSFIKEINQNIEDLNLDPDMIKRSVNVGFSGGEKKKNEVLQLKMLKPKLIILDELDSGLDVDSLKICLENINKYLEENKDVSVLIITHYPRILDYIKVDYVHILNDGKIIKTGDVSLAHKIEKEGYNWVKEENKI